MMKVKPFILVMILVLVCFSISYAEVETIKFWNLEWGISPNEFKKAIEDKDIEFDMEKDMSDDIWFPFQGQDYYDGFLYLTIPNCRYVFSGTIDSSLNRKPLMNVAGYDVSSICAYFRASYSLITNSVGKADSLARVAYRLVVPDKLKSSDVYEDLKRKLSELYGISTGEDEFEVWWYAADGTGVCLQDVGSEYKHKGGYDYVMVTYGIADETQYYRDIETIQNAEKEKVLDDLSDNYNGL